MASNDGKPEELLRIVLVGDSGSGKSKTGNTILGKRAFKVSKSLDTETITCQAERGEFEGTPVSVVDTPRSIRPNTTEMSKCISYCAPGPHAFLLVMPLEKYTDLERHVKSLQQAFGEDASRYTIILFSHEYKLPDWVTAERFIRHNPLPYGVGCHIFNNRDEDPSQVRELLEKIKRMVQRNGGNYCIKVKDWKQQYRYPLFSAVTIGCGIGAASGGTGAGVLVAFLGSVVGAVAAADGGNAAVAAAVVVAVVVAVVAAEAVYVAGAESNPGTVDWTAARVAGTSVAGAISTVAIFAVGAGAVSVASAVAGSKAGFAGLTAAWAAGTCAFIAAIVAVVDAGAGAADVGFAVMTQAGVVIGAGIFSKITGGIFTGAGTAGAAFKVFDDIDLRAEAIWGIIGGAGVGAGVSAAVLAYADCDLLNAVGAGFTVISLLTVLLIIASIKLSSISKTAGLAIAAVFAGAAFGAAAGVLGASHFAAHYAGVIITIVCKAMAMGLNK